MCKEAVASTQEQDGGGLASGIQWGIVSMMAAPYALFGLVTWLIVRHMRRERREQTN